MKLFHGSESTFVRSLRSSLLDFAAVSPNPDPLRREALALGLCVKLDDPDAPPRGCHSRLCPACHHTQNRKKVERAVRRVALLDGAVASPFYMLSASGERFEDMTDVAASVTRITNINRTLWRQLLAGNRRVHGTYFGVAFSPRGRLHTHAIVHGEPNLKAIDRFWRCRGFEPDADVTEARSARDVTAYALRGFVEWPEKPYGERTHRTHPDPTMLATIRAALAEAPDRPAFTRPYGSFCGRWRVALNRSEP